MLTATGLVESWEQTPAGSVVDERESLPIDLSGPHWDTPPLPEWIDPATITPAPYSPHRRHPGGTPRRDARLRRHRGHPVPRQPELGHRRVLRGRCLLRALRLPHHHAPARRVAGLGRGGPALLLGPPGPPAVAGALPHDGGGGRGGGAPPPGARFTGSPRGHPGHGGLRGQLAPDLLLPRQLLRHGGQPLPPPAHLDPGHRGAVLPDLAPGRAGVGRGLPPPPSPPVGSRWSAPSPAGGRGGGGRRRGLGPAHGRSSPRWVRPR